MLTGNNRQNRSEDGAFRKLLTRLCVGNCTNEDYALLSSRVINHCTSRHLLEEFSSVPVIICDNATKDALNEKFVRQFAESTNQELHHYWSEDYINNEPVTASSPHILVLNALHTGVSHGVLYKIPLAIGMPIMVTNNVCIESGIANGSIRSVHSILYKTTTDGRGVLTCCIVSFPKSTSASMPGLSPNLYPILPQTIYFTYTHQRRYCWFIQNRLPSLLEGLIGPEHGGVSSFWLRSQK